MPFSVFPSSYKEKAEAESKTQITHEELEIRLPEKAGREGQYSSGVHAPAHLPPRREQHRFNEEEVRFTREEERYHRPGVKVHEEYRPKHSRLVIPIPLISLFVAIYTSLENKAVGRLIPLIWG